MEGAAPELATVRKAALPVVQGVAVHAAARHTPDVELLMVAGWVLLVLLTVGPIFSALKRDGDGGWFWIVAALLLGPLAGVGYYMSRHAMRKVDAAGYEPKHAKG